MPDTCPRCAALLPGACGLARVPARCPACGGELAPAGAAATTIAGSPLPDAETIDAGASPPIGGAPEDPTQAGKSFGRYRLLAPLGAGGMGVVWKAWDTRLGRVVALKQIKNEAVADAPTRERFLREARLAARLHHPRIVAVHDVGTVGEQHYISLEYVPGRSLAAILAAGAGGGRPASPCGIEDARRDVALIVQVAEAVGYAHAQGVIHRDLKPANVLVDSEGQPHVVDFGLAKEMDGGAGSDPAAAATRMTLSGQMLGTPAYMSPEQATGDLARIGPRSDVWALGVTLYEALCGHLPFLGPTPLDTLRAVLRDEPPRPPAAARALLGALEGVWLRALEKDPARRYATADEFAAELRRWLDGEPVRAERPTVRRRVGRWAGRHRRPLVAAAALALALGGALAWGRYERYRRRATSAALFAQVAVAVAGFEDAVHRTDVSAEVKDQLARQPLGLLERLIEQDSSADAAFAWRGQVEAILGRSAEADADYDRACARAPEQATPWLLRGLHRIDAYERARRSFVVTSDVSGTTLDCGPAESAAERALREAGLADLDAARRAGTAGPAAGDDLVRIARALSVLYSGRPEALAESLRALSGMAHPRAQALCGRALLGLARYGESVATFAQALERWPNWPEVRGLCALARQEAGGEAERSGGDPRPWYRGAVADLDLALRGLPAAAELWNARGCARLALAAADGDRHADPREEIERARTDFDQALRLQPGYTEALVGRGCARQDLGEAAVRRGEDPRARYREALADLDAAVARDPAMVSAWLNRANTWRLLGIAEAARRTDPTASLQKAIADYDEALRRAPGSAAALLDRGVARRSLADAQAARGQDPLPPLRASLADLDAALRARPGLAAALRQRAAAWLRFAQAEAARGADPRPSLARAIADFNDLLHALPDDVGVWTSRGDAWASTAEAAAARGEDPRADLDRALADYDAAVRRDPHDSRARYNRGSAFGQLGNVLVARGEDGRAAFRQAVAEYAALLETDPKLTRARFQRGNTLLVLAQAEGARGQDAAVLLSQAEADLRTVVAEGLPEAWLKLGMLYGTCGRYDEAIAAFEAGARAVPARAVWAREMIEKTRRGKEGNGGK